MLMKITRALISVSDKTGIVDLALYLQQNNVEIISTGGTAKALEAAGIKVTEISDYTGFPEMMDGRVKTLHPMVHGGLLGNVHFPEHVEKMEQYKILPINLVIINLYPFAATVAKNASYDECVENIDIGGPSMIRSCAKNHACNTVIVDPADYDELKKQLAANQGTIKGDFRTAMAAKAFNLTAQYDVMIAEWFNKQVNKENRLFVAADKSCDLRYGENPHQKASLFVTNKNCGIPHAKQIQGKELSYNNINDADAALTLVQEFKEPAASIIKHANPCGVAVGADIFEAYCKAHSSDPLSAFGGIVALNHEIDAKLATKMAEIFYEVIIAPSITDEAKEIFAAKKNLRILICDVKTQDKSALVKSIQGGYLVQDFDSMSVSVDDLEFVTDLKPNEDQIKEMLFAFNICKHVKSNAIVISENGSTIGVGAGQMSRIDSVNIAIAKLKEHKHGERISSAVLASDAFFPFSDGIIAAAKYGVKIVIQPGGSVRDEEVIKAANDHGMIMAFTAIRHFKH
jgi:phosphoribosylaminoimidazolecarboxamide formyltransferase / IMP cyclohydrolase